MMARTVIYMVKLFAIESIGTILCSEGSIRVVCRLYL